MTELTVVTGSPVVVFQWADWLRLVAALGLTPSAALTEVVREVERLIADIEEIA